MFKKVNPKQNFPEMERELMDSWRENKIFEKSVQKDQEVDKTKPASAYSFFDGPPFATGLPHYGNLVASLIKDVVPRYQTMRGHKVERKWGWDCHGLPIENLIEKEHGIKNKQDIEKWGVDKFNEACHNSVLRYADEWKKFIPRIGRWVDMDNDYRTMDWKYMESIWWVFSELYKKGLIYEGNKSMHICPRCETTLSNFEVTQGYKTIKDLSATAKFKLDSGQKIGDFITDDNTYILAWTTTPWTLIGNVALAVSLEKEDIYILFTVKESSHSSFIVGETYILSKNAMSRITLASFAYAEGQGNAMIGPVGGMWSSVKCCIETDNYCEFAGGDIFTTLKYKSLFDYYFHKGLQNEENGWKIYAGDFVSTEEGTGIVHIAPAFGEDDMKMGGKYNLPFIQHVGMDGIIRKEAGEFAGTDLKPRAKNKETEIREADLKIVKFLGEKIFHSEKYEHSYPHCWRCDTPLINYATSSWFVKVTAIKDKMIKNNKEIKWVPEYIKEGRFGKWLEDARDWAISRSRFWGALLPVWKCKECNERTVIGSIDELRKNTDRKITKFIFMRHGESGKNLEGIKSDSLDKYPLTEEGIGHAEHAANELENKKIDIIIASPVLRARQTAEIISKILKVEVSRNDLVMEYKYGKWNDKTSKYLLENDEIYKEYKKITDLEKKYDFVLGGDGESRRQMEARVRKFIDECINKYPGKNILVVSHGGLNGIFKRVLSNISIKGHFRAEMALGYCETETFYVDESGKEFNMHKPNIDKIKAKCPKCGKDAEIVGEVFDCWFESGSMPYGQWHYPFENQNKFNESFPADFIAEGLDQTRGWFYTLIVLSTALFNKPAFKNVIVNGIVLAEDGQKMSKSLKNYPDPNLLIEKYGADSLRYYLVSSPVMKGEDLNFSEKGVEEALKRFLLILWNTYSFLIMNLDMAKLEAKDLESKKVSDNLLDRWIISELNLLINEVGAGMENYDLAKASRPLKDFVDKLSNWFLRRSRKRFSSENDAEDRMNAFRTLYQVMIEYSKVMAPFMPFFADEMFKNLSGKESVHLEKFPETKEGSIDNELSQSMDLARRATTLALAARAKNSIKVRMPLGKLEIGKSEIAKDMNNVYDAKDKFTDALLNDELYEIMKEELNVKEAGYVDKFVIKEGWAYEDDGTIKIGLDLGISEELENEGFAREIVRHVQTMRKEIKYNRDDEITIKYNFQKSDAIFQRVFDKWADYIMKECLAKSIEFSDKLISSDFDLVKKLKLDDSDIEVGIEKQ